MAKNIYSEIQLDEANMLYSKNLNWLNERYGIDYERLKEQKYAIETLEFDEKGNRVNVLINGVPLYPEDAPAHAAKQMEDADCFEKENVYLTKDNNYTALTGRSYAIRHIVGLECANINDAGLTSASIGKKLLNQGAISFADLTKDGLHHVDYQGRSFVLCFGLGLGYHISLLLEKYDIANLIIFETNMEFIQHAAHIHDFEKWNEKCTENKGQLFIIGPRQIKEKITDLALLSFIYRSLHYPLIDNNMIFHHLKHIAYDDFLKNFTDNVRMVCLGKGFLEDELCMFNNTSINIFRNMTGKRARNDKVLTKKTIDFSKLPLLLVANGPSLDDSIETIREKAEQGYLIMACGSTLYSLLSYGIFPDYFVNLENSFHTYWTVRNFCKDYMSDPRWKEIVFVGFPTSSPSLIRLFDKNLYVVRWTSSGGKYITYSTLNDKVAKISDAHLQYASPNVVNLASTAALAIGFREIYLLGTDLGTKTNQTNHSKNSFYKQEEYSGRRIVKCDNGYDKDDLIHSKLTGFNKINNALLAKKRGNFGGKVASDFILEGTVSTLNLLFSHLERVHQMRYQIYNCSDGRYIEATTPLHHKLIPDLPEELRGLKQTEKDRLYNHHYDIELSDEACNKYKERLQFSIDNILAQSNEVKELLARLKNQKTFVSADIETLILDILEIIKAKDDGDIEKVGVDSMLTGTVSILLYHVHKIFSKLPSDKYDVFLEIITEHIENAFEQYHYVIHYFLQRMIDDLGKYDCMNNYEIPKSYAHRYFYNHHIHELLLKQKKIASLYPGIFFEEYCVGYEQEKSLESS